jgi:hypothetical protein
MPPKFCVLNNKLICGCRWALIALALTWGSGRAAYLPVVGPVPIRFIPDRRPSALVRLVVPPPAKSGNGYPGSTNGPAPMSIADWVAGMVLPDFLTSSWPFEGGMWPGIDQETLPAANPQSSGDIAEIRAFFPQQLIPFFGPTGAVAAGSNQPVQPLMLEFTPPTRTPPSSSSAIYTRH